MRFANGSKMGGVGAVRESPLRVVSGTRAPSRPESAPGRSDFGVAAIEPRAHLPAFAVRAGSGDSGKMVEPIAPFKDIEFPKNSINIDKLTGFFDKFP